MPASISPAELKSLLQAGNSIDLIDVRTPMEFQAIHLEMARNEPLDRLDPKAVQAARNGSSQKPLYVICRSGARGSQACAQFVAAGFPNVVNVEGGTMACEAAGLPVVRGKQTIPLNCQVQIVTGTLVILGSVLAYALHPYWLALPIMMGSGLVFSGITNTCAMGTFLARMPWNQCKDGACPT